MSAGEWQSVLSGAEGAVREQRIVAADVLRALPVDVLVLSK
jgi:(1->4)-alpha-D-glucan 1-alpha-D-glucosylmutase